MLLYKTITKQYLICCICRRINGILPRRVNMCSWQYCYTLTWSSVWMY